MTVFTPLISGFVWQPSTTDVNGNPLPAGETSSGSTIGIRADGTGVAGTYTYLVIVPANSSAESVVALNQAIGKALVPGNYWAAIDQTDVLNGSSITSAWTAEVPFSIPAPAPVIVRPAPPSNFTAA